MIILQLNLLLMDVEITSTFDNFTSLCVFAGVQSLVLGGFIKWEWNCSVRYNISLGKFNR